MEKGKRTKEKEKEEKVNMRFLKNYKVFESDLNSGISEIEIENYLKSKFTSDWFDMELSDRVNDYIDEDDAEPYDGDLEEAYKNLATGGAIEYDLLSEMVNDVADKFGLDNKFKYDKSIESRTISDIVNDHLIDECSWYDRYTFRKSNEPYRSSFSRLLGSDFGKLSKEFDDLDD
jgi:hypothetical protein